MGYVLAYQQARYIDAIIWFNSSVTDFPDFPLIKLPQKPTSFLRKITEVAPGHNTGYSYVHAHIIDNIASMSLTILDGDFQSHM